MWGCVPGPGGGCTWSGGVPAQVLPPCGKTDTCKNITIVVDGKNTVTNMKLTHLMLHSSKEHLAFQTGPMITHVNTRYLHSVHVSKNSANS